MIRKYETVNPTNQGPVGPRGPVGPTGPPGAGITDELISKIQNMEERIKQLEDMIKKTESK